MYRQEEGTLCRFPPIVSAYDETELHILQIGINYRGQPNQLFGCVNDARNVQRFLISEALIRLYRRFASLICGLPDHGYKSRDIVLLTDDAKDPRLLPTRANIIERMRELVRGAQTHDSLFFHCMCSQTHL